MASRHARTFSSSCAMVAAWESICWRLALSFRCRLYWHREAKGKRVRLGGKHRRRGPALLD